MSVEVSIVDQVKRVGISDNVLESMYATYPDRPDLAVEQLIKFFEYKNYTIKTICKRVLPKIKKYLIAAGDFRQRGWGAEVTRILYDRYKSKIQEINLEYDRSVQPEKKEFIATIDHQKILNWAIATLKNESRWHRVSLALAVVSGRRMVEIHGEDRGFDIGNGIIIPIVNGREIDKVYNFPQTLIFSGQAKSRSRNDINFEIPVLCDPQLFIARWQSLPPERLNQDSTTVNRVISSAISTATKKLRPELGIKKYKDSRDIYITLVMKHFDRAYDLSEKERENLKGHILGHEIKIATSERYGK